jgi:hypothetical protein
VEPYAKRAFPVPKTGREIQFRGRWSYRRPLSKLEYPMICNMFCIILQSYLSKQNLTFTFKQYFYSDMPTCKPTLYLDIDSKVNLTCSFYNYKFSVARKMLCTPWPRNPLTSLRLSCLGRKRPWRQFFSRYVKERFCGLDIQIIIV